MTELCADGVAVRYGDVVAVHAVDLALVPGRLIAVTGPSGAGKSSLLWALAGAVAPSEGRVTYAGQPVVSREQAARLGIAVVPQGNGLASSLTAAENVLVPLLAAGVPAREAHQRTRDALGTVGLEENGHQLVEELSGGQQQRVALARGFAARPAVLLADEPTSDLDAGNRERVIDTLRAETDRGALVLMATHDPEAAAAADAELALDEGRAHWRRPLSGR